MISAPALLLPRLQHLWYRCFPGFSIYGIVKETLPVKCGSDQRIREQSIHRFHRNSLQGIIIRR
jgi:hypothetical protein